MRWVLMLGGLGIWLTHFLGVYLLASLADLMAPSHGDSWRAATLAFSAACLCLCGGIGWLGTLPRLQAWLASPIQQRLTLGGAMLGFVAVAWQTLAAVI